MFIYVGGGGGTKAVVHVYKMASVVSSPTQKLSRRVFLPFVPSLIKIHFWRPHKGTGNVLKKARVEINGFKVLKAAMSLRYIWTTRNRMHKTNYSEWMLYGLRKKVSCPPSTVLHFEFSKNTRRTYDLKLNALLIFRNSQGSCSENDTWQRTSMKLSSSSPLAGT